MSSNASALKALALYQILLCVHNIAVFIGCGLKSMEKQPAWCEPNTWPPGSSEPGHNIDACTHTLPHTDRSNLN